MLTNTIVEEARQIGYERMRLDTLAGQMERADRDDTLAGFQENPSLTTTNPVAGATFMDYHWFDSLRSWTFSRESVAA